MIKSLGEGKSAEQFLGFRDLEKERDREKEEEEGKPWEFVFNEYLSDSPSLPPPLRKISTTWRLETSTVNYSTSLVQWSAKCERSKFDEYLLFIQTAPG